MGVDFSESPVFVNTRIAQRLRSMSRAPMRHICFSQLLKVTEPDADPIFLYIGIGGSRTELAGLEFRMRRATLLPSHLKGLSRKDRICEVHSIAQLRLLALLGPCLV